MCIGGGYLDLKSDKGSHWPAAESDRARRSVRSHQHLFFEGDERTHVYVIEAGWVKLYRTLIDGQRQAVGFLDHGAIVGLEGGEDHSNACQAVTDVTFRAILVGRLGELCGNDPEFAARVLRQVGDQLGTAQSHLTTVGAQSAEQKLATFLLAMSDHDAAGDSFDLPMRRTDMGEFLGLRLETVSRKMADFQRHKWIRMESMYRCRILNREVLEALAAGGAADDVAFGSAGR